MSRELFRLIPKVDEILAHEDWQRLIEICPEEVAKDALRGYLEGLRANIKEKRLSSIPETGAMIAEVRKRGASIMAPKLKRVINGTGTIIHTSLGRSLLAKPAIDAMINMAANFSNLEYNLRTGTRGDRHEHCVATLRKLTGAEKALVVNNNAAAVFLVLNTFAEGKEVIISRGELVEIGGSFRIPDVMKKSGAILREVGTTNRTYIGDYERAINENTGLIMKVHTSNFRIRGFTHEATMEEIVALGKTNNISTYYDAGSGLLYSERITGPMDEHIISQEVAKGLDIVSFSGDKLLGAPQAGIVVGEKTFVDAMKKNPLTRALRPDKITLAGLESTLLLYLDMEMARTRIPTLRMIHEDPEVLRGRARRLAGRLRKSCSDALIHVDQMYSEVGGGSFPDMVIPSWGISLKPNAVSLTIFEERLRNLELPIIGRIEKEKFILDMRTISKEEEGELLSGLETALGYGQ